MNNLSLGKILELFNIKNSDKDKWSIYYKNIINKLYNALENNKCVEGVIDFSSFKKEEEFIFLDLGANIGINSIMVLLFFPKAKVYAVEGSPNSFKIMEDNFKTFSKFFDIEGRYKIFNLLISKHDDKEEIIYDTKGFSMGSTASKEIVEEIKKQDETVQFMEKKVKTISLLKLLNVIGEPKIDIAKIDIEGSEYDTFEWVNSSVIDSDLTSKYKRITKLAIETHGSRKKQSDLLNELYRFWGDNLIFNADGYVAVSCFNSDKKGDMIRLLNSRFYGLKKIFSK